MIEKDNLNILKFLFKQFFSNSALFLSIKLFSIISKNQTMSSLQRTICRRTVVEFDPQKWCNRLGNKCQTCNISLTHQRCVSLCKCYYFCHQACFSTNFESQLKDEEIDIRCIHCEQILRIDLDATFKYAPSKSLIKIGKAATVAFLLILNVLAIALTLNNVLKPDLSFFLLYLQGLILSLLLYLLVIYVRDVLYVKSVKIKEILSTKLQIQTSAFKDIDLHSNDQFTKDALIFQVKKEKE